MAFEKLATETLSLARAAHIHIVTAESCTGGLLAGALTEIAGASDVFERGFVTYSNAAKRDMLGVSAITLQKYGAVSEEVAMEMASGALHHSNGNIAVSITGIAGPGGSDHKPEGRVCFAIATPSNDPTATTVEFGAIGREKVRVSSVRYALEMLRTTLDSPLVSQMT